MAVAGVIAEFLASVGFTTDEASLDAALSKVKGFGLAIGAIGAAAAAAVVAVAEKYDELGRASEKLGVPVAKLQELNYIAQQSGASAEAVSASLAGIRAANPGIKDAAAALDRAGQNMQGMSRAARQAYADRMGIDPALIPMLIKDTSELKAEWAGMYGAAGIDAQQAAEASRGLMEELGKLKSISTMLADAISLTFVVRIRRDVERLRRGIMEHFGAIKRVMETVIGVALRIVGAVATMAARIIGWLMRIVEWFEGLDDSQQKVVLGAAALLAAWRMLNLGFLATPIGMLVTGLTAIVGLVDDYLTYMEGGESFFDWGPWEATITRCVNALKPIASLVKGFAVALGATVLPALDLFGAAISGIGTMVRHVVELIVALFSGDLDGALAAGTALIGAYIQTVQDVFAALCRTIAAFFGALWPSVVANFPDFAAWAEGAARAITETIGAAVAWLSRQMERVSGWMPGWMKGRAAAPAGGASLDGPALIPPPSVAASAGGNAGAVKLDQKTEINVYSNAADPNAVGQAVAARQDDVNARMVRNTQGAVR